MPTYTVIGIYTDPFGQRFATHVEADTPQEAEIEAVGEADSGLIVAGVVEGHVQLVDMYTDGYTDGVPQPPE